MNFLVLLHLSKSVQSRHDKSGCCKLVALKTRLGELAKIEDRHLPAVESGRYEKSEEQ